MNGYFIGVLGKLGGNGLEEVVQIEMNTEEKAAFQKSVEAVQGLVEACKKVQG